MKVKRLCSMVGLGFVCSLTAQRGSAQARVPVGDDVTFDYDGSVPLGLKDSVAGSCGLATIHDISYTGAQGRAVHAFLVTPEPGRKAPALLFEHWANGTRAEFLGEACLYAEHGALSILPDYAWDDSADEAPNHFLKPETDRAIKVRAVIESRRALDVLAARSDVDSKKIAVIGHSFGAQWASLLAVVDHRVRFLVLMAGAGNEGDLLLPTKNTQIAELRNALPKGTLDRYCDALSDLDAERFLPQVRGVSVLMQFGTFDQFLSIESMRALAGVAPPGAAVKYYEADHEVNDPQALADRSQWIASQLGLDTVR
jgi:dienelactone hydrolase